MRIAVRTIRASLIHYYLPPNRHPIPSRYDFCNIRRFRWRHNMFLVPLGQSAQG